MQYFESVYIHATLILFPFISSDCATKSYLVLAPKVKCLGRSIAYDFLKQMKGNSNIYLKKD